MRHYYEVWHSSGTLKSYLGRFLAKDEKEAKRKANMRYGFDEQALTATR